MITSLNWKNFRTWLAAMWHHFHAGTLPEAPVAGGAPVAMSPVNPAIPTPPVPEWPTSSPDSTPDITITDGCFGHSAKVDAALAEIHRQRPYFTPPVSYLFEGMLPYLHGAALLEANFQLDNRFPLIAGAEFDPDDMAKDSWLGQIVSVTENPAKAHYPEDAPERYTLVMGKNGQSGAKADTAVFGRNYKTAEQVIAYLNALPHDEKPVVGVGSGFIGH